MSVFSIKHCFCLRVLNVLHIVDLLIPVNSQSAFCEKLINKFPCESIDSIISVKTNNSFVFKPYFLIKIFKFFGNKCTYSTPSEIDLNLFSFVSEITKVFIFYKLLREIHKLQLFVLVLNHIFPKTNLIFVINT